MTRSDSLAVRMTICVDSDTVRYWTILILSISFSAAPFVSSDVYDLVVAPLSVHPWKLTQNWKAWSLDRYHDNTDIRLRPEVNNTKVLHHYSVMGEKK